ncbi:MAG: Aspartate aminotransferase [Acidimicrobiales bacterium]|nr:MAG: aminotransferase class I/II-fold pyridoxal phosphate-dependent enzyme [Actinomycetota bacterium]MBV6507474.1 Aspartate aminotransferase [Acidimicrobiales bacterium]RIK07852.1 MAG: aspartate aminotransferase [Acidobacteriota bacterium]
MAERDVQVNLNLRVRGMGPSSTVAINERCDELRARGKQVFKLGLGQSPFPVPEPVVEALRQNAGQKAYLPVKGLKQLREAVAHYHARNEGIDVDAEAVLIGPGSKELMFLLQLVYYGDLVIPTPAWVSYAPQADIIGRRVSWIHTDPKLDWKLTPDQLGGLCSLDPGRPRIVVLNYPSNPTGGTYTPDELDALARTAEQHRVVLLSDEIYGELHHDGAHDSIASHYPQGTIISGGLSKWCGAGGWRLGTFTFPPAMGWLRDAMAAVASETYTSTSAPIQYAAITAFEGGEEIEQYLKDVRRILKALGNWCAGRLNSVGVHTMEPLGAFYLFPDFSPLADRLEEHGIDSCTSLSADLLEEIGAAVLPGTEFGCMPDELTVRLAYVDFDGALALQAITDLGDEAMPDDAFLRSNCPSVVTAVERICEWVSDL